ncbi:zinc-dependent metalloprotease [Zobellia sp. OII3]|nr:zinc-dependent metalloprotease [Zobellia sp. OII3]
MIELNNIRSIAPPGSKVLIYLFVLLFLTGHKVWGGANTPLEIPFPSLRTELSPPHSNTKFVKAHLQEGRLYLEIPVELLDKDMLFIRHNSVEQQAYKHVAWSRSGTQIFLEAPRVKSLSGVTIPVDNDPDIEKSIMAVFQMIPEKSNSKMLYIDATELFLSNTGMWGAGSNAPLLKELSSLYEYKLLENELIVKTKRATGKEGKIHTHQVDYSLFVLPEPMKPRRFDYRMGFFCEDVKSPINHMTKSAKANISRWRLEKKYPDRPLSIPIQSINFTLSPEIPKKWRPYVRAGILEWLPAFEAAGYKDAITISEFSARDNDWNENSVNRSMVRWGNKRSLRGFEDNSGSNASTVIDLRSGEILKSDILIGSSYQSLSDEYFVRCAPLDPRALQYPFPDDLMGELVQSLVAHEAGHAFGMMDANFGEYAYPFTKMRNPEWLKKMGHSPSIMSYARHNYLPQPEDGLAPSLLIHKVGPTDKYYIKWAYSPCYRCSTKEEEEYLEQLIEQQDTIPWYRYNKSRQEIIGPGATNEVVENNDPVRSTALGLQNIKRVFTLLPKVNKTEKDYALVKRLYDKTVELWYREMKHVLSMIGGSTIQYKSGNQKGGIYTPIAWSRQEEALDFLLENAFKNNNELAQPEFMYDLRYSTYPDTHLEFQIRLLLELMDSRRMKRLEHIGLKTQDKNLQVRFLGQIRSGLFEELQEEYITIDSMRQTIQNTYVRKLIMGITKPKDLIEPGNNLMTYGHPFQGLLLSELNTLKKELSLCMGKKMDVTTRGHLLLLLKSLENI